MSEILPDHDVRPISSTRAVERAMDLLAQVCDQGEIGLAECARRAGLAPSTALRLLRTLETSHLVSRDERGLFRAGPRLIQLGAAALGRQSLVRAAEPALRRIVQGCGESTYLCLPGPTDSAVYAGMVEGLHSVRHTSWVGRSIPLRGSAAGAAFRGEVPPSGYVLMRSAVEPDITAIAAPVLRPGSSGGGVEGPTTIAVLSVVGPTYRMDDEQAATIGSLVSREARALSRQFAVAGLHPQQVAETG
ncbi:urocanate hydratase [Nakamurella sp. UYEF19]|uniref:IclR family transcriptional regulator n=1 Tax=Nakamurella sp. UYEF19 TaxID=1756392 RepID=UPI0033998AA2